MAAAWEFCYNFYQFGSAKKSLIMHLFTQENGREICNYCYLKVHFVD